MPTKKQFVNKVQTKESVRSEIVRQQKNAYYLVKYLRAKTPRKVSYVISTEIEYRNGFWIPKTIIRELPEVRIGVNMTESDDEFMKNIEIENIEG